VAKKMTSYKDTPQQKIHEESLRLSKNSLGIIPFIEGEVVHFEEEVKAFRAGEREDSEFMPFRLRQGVYGQRQPDRQMMRIKLPGGVATPLAIETLGTIASEYAPLQKGHITTRENMQFHHILLEDAPAVMRLLGTAGLSTREACGNTVRNVVGCPMAGVCSDEVFDITPYLAAYVRWATRHPLTQNFPRKFKTAFSGCKDHDCIVAPMHDMSFIAQTKTIDGVEKRGFKVILGGGTSIMAKLGKVLYDFCPVEDYLRVAEAVWTVFENADMLRKNRMMARIKVLIDRLGFDTVKEMIEKELVKLEPIDPAPFLSLDDSINESPPPLSSTENNDTDENFLLWKETNVVAQKQPGYYAAFINIPLGDIFHNQFLPLAEIVRNYTGGQARVTQEQNMVLRWIPESSLMDVWKALKTIDLADGHANSIKDVVSCPGTDSCKLGITSSMGLARGLQQSLISMNGDLDDPLVNKMHIKISGCPNGCGMHHIADIGFQGAALKGTGGQVPAYEVFIGGQYNASVETTRYGERLKGVRVPSKRIPNFVKEIVAYYKTNRDDSEGFSQFVDRIGLDSLREIGMRYKEVNTLQDDSEGLYLDWEKANLYQVERGEGECMV